MSQGMEFEEPTCVQGMLAEGSDPEAPPQPSWGGRRRLLFSAAALLGVGSMLALAVLASRGASGLRPPWRQANSTAVVALDDAQAQVTLCVIDVNQAIFYLAQAGNFIKFSTAACKDTETAEAKRACASAIATVIASFGWVSSYLAAAVNSCGSVTNIQAACGASLGGVIAELGEFAFITSAITDACDINPGNRRLGEKKGVMQKLEKHGVDKEDAKTALDFFRKVVKKAKKEDEPNLRPAAISQCIADLDIGITYIGRVGLQAYDLSKDCPKTDPESRKACALNVLNILSSFAWAAQFLSFAAVDCPKNPTSEGAACAGVVSDFVAVVAAFGPLMNGVTDDCQPNGETGDVGYADFE